MAQARQEGGAAGEENGFDIGRGEGHGGEELVEVGGDLCGELGGVALELGAREVQVEGDARVVEIEGGGVAGGERDFGGLEDLKEREALVFLDEGDEALESGGVVGEADETPEEVEDFGVVEEGDLVPLAELAVDRVGDLEFFAPAVVGGAAAEERGDLVPHGGGVVFVAGDGQTAGGEDVGHAIGVAGAGGIELHDGEIGSAAAEVADEDACWAGDAGLVGEGGSDGFVLEMDRGEAGGLSGAVQALLGEFIFGGHGGEDGGAAEDDAFYVLACDGVGTGFEVVEEDRDQVLDGEFLVVNEGLGEGRVGEDGLDGLEETSAHAVGHVAGAGGVADDGFDASQREGEVEKRGVHAGDARVAHELSRGGVPNGDGGVTGAEIDAVNESVHE